MSFHLELKSQYKERKGKKGSKMKYRALFVYESNAAACDTDNYEAGADNNNNWMEEVDQA